METVSGTPQVLRTKTIYLGGGASVTLPTGPGSGLSIDSSGLSIDSSGLSIDIGELAANVARNLDRNNSSPGTKLTLSDEQMERARGLGLSDHRIGGINARAGEAQRIISLLDENTSLNLYLYSIVEHFYTHGNFKNVFTPQEFSKDIKALNAQIFTPEVISSGICFSAPFYGTDSTIDVYNIILGLLYSWNTLGESHPYFGKLFPTTTDPSVSVPRAYLNAWKNYTYLLGDANIRDPYYEIPMLEVQSGYIRSGAIKEGEIPSALLPIVFSSVPLIRQKTGIPVDIGLLDHVQEMYVLGGATNKIGLHHKVVRLFLNRHYEYFIQNPALCVWQDSFDILKSIVKGKQNTETTIIPQQSVKKPQKKIKPRVPAIPISSTPSIPLPIVSIPQIPTILPLPEPTVFPSFAYLMGGTGIPHKKINTVVTNFPPHTQLILISQQGDGDVIEIGRYDSGDTTITLPSITSQTVFTFSFVDTETDPSKTRSSSEVKIIVTPKIAKELSQSPVVQAGVQRNIEDVVSGALVELPKPLVAHPADSLVLDILEFLESPQIGSALTSDEKYITLRFPGDSEIQARYDLKTGRITLIGGDTGFHDYILQNSENELKWIFENEVIQINIVEQQRILKKFDPIVNFLETSFGSLSHDGEDSDIASALAGARINEYSAGRIFAQLRYDSTFLRLQAQCRLVGVEIAIIESNEGNKEFAISISLRGESGISGTISTKTPPIIGIPNMDQLLEVTIVGTSMDIEHRKKLTHILRLMITTMSVAGKRISDSQSETQSTPKKNNNSKNSQPILTLEDIKSILDGTYHKPRQSWDVLDKASQNQIQYAIKRLSKNPGEGRQFVRGGFSETTGYYACQVTGHHSWDTLLDDDMVILWDERISSVANGQKGNPYIYDMIRASPRLQKYLILKMIATAKNSTWKGKTPFTNGLRVYFDDFWKNISEDIKQKFLKDVAGIGGKASNGLNIELPNRTGLFDSFLAGAEELQIPLRYSRPSHMSVVELKSYQGEISQKLDVLPEETDD